MTMDVIYKLRIIIVLSFTFIFSTHIAEAPAYDISNEVNEFTTFYYQRPVPEKAPEMLKKFIQSDFFQSKEAYKNDVAGLTAYFFGRLGQISPELKEQYRHIFEQSNHQGRYLVADVFGHCASESDRQWLLGKANEPGYEGERDFVNKIFGPPLTPPIDLANMEIKKDDQLDYYWLEFFVTGNTQAVKQIFNVVKWPDKSRDKIQSFLNSNAAESKKNTVKQILRDSFEIQFKEDEILSKDDIDVKIAHGIMMRGQRPAFKALSEAIPFLNEEMGYYATKGAAAWSVNSNAGQHEEILRFLESEINTLNGAPRLLALQYAAFSELDRNEDEAALRNIKKAIELDPTSVGAHQLLYLMFMKKGDAEGMTQQMATIEVLNPVLAKELKSVQSKAAQIVEQKW